MPEEPEQSSSPHEQYDHPASTLHNASIARCCEAFDRTYDALTEEGRSRIVATDRARDSFRKAMPPLIGAANIRDFIACVGQGMIMNVIGQAEAVQLLRAARVALAADRHNPAEQRPAA